MKTIKSVLLVLFLPINMAFTQEKGTPMVLPQVTVVPIKDTEANKQYELYIELPEDYSEHPDKKYPVLYYTDAMWHIEILSASMEYIMNDVILVGISWQKDIDESLINERGEHVSRFRDYTVKPSSNPVNQAKYQIGQSSNHLAFIRNDVFEYVESNYRTDPKQRSYFGYSLGGVFGTYVLLAQPDSFKNYILGSPALEGDIPFLTELSTKEAKTSQGMNANVFISYGTLEEELGGYTEQLITLLKERKDSSLSIRHVLIEGSHQTAFPMTGVKSVSWLAKRVKE